jgi:nucleoside-triphosphatase
MHVFLTGLRGIGKTTVITKVVDDVLAGGSVSAEEVAGFRTVWTRIRGAEALYLLPYNTKRTVPNVFPVAKVFARPVAERDMTNQTLTIHPEIFDEDGVAIVRAAMAGALRPGLIIMDELGFMESDSYEFQKAVVDALDDDVPILGVMRWERNSFLDAVAGHEKVEVVEVNKSNRDALPTKLAAQIFHE